jgi:hypothetical protein
MSDTNHHHAPSGDPVEFDAVSYSGIVWFVVILTGTVLASQLIVWGLYEWFDYRVTRAEAPRAAMADAPTRPEIQAGRLVSGADNTPRPSLLVDEPTVNREFYGAQREAQRTYGWIDQAQGTIRLPIERAKDLVLERGLAARPAPAAPVPAEATAPTAAPVVPVAAPTPASAPAAH